MKSHHGLGEASSAGEVSLESCISAPGNVIMIQDCSYSSFNRAESVVPCQFLTLSSEVLIFQDLEGASLH